MLRALTLLIACLLLPLPILANECEQAGHDAEQASGLPADLLTAIGRVESGRRMDGHVAPWPWSVNAAGQGYYLPSEAAAIALVRSLQARGIQSIDVGCFQVNLLYHAQAFTSLEDAFAPASNARAAAAFLNSLRTRASGLEEAVGNYHSADPSRSIPYAHMVMASWHGGAEMAAPPISRVAALVRVYVPGGPAAGMAAGLVRGAGLRLPIVIVPSGARL